MTFRAVCTGLLLALGISLFTYFNDHIIRQTYIIGNHLPVAVFGPLIFLLILVNPLMRRLGIQRTISGREIAVIAALGLFVCGWPGSGFFRTFSAAVSQPVNMERTNPSWKATHVMSYTPSVSARIGRGHVNDWQALTEKLARGRDSSAVPWLRRIWSTIPDYAQGTVVEAAEGEAVRGEEQRIIIAGLNDCIRARDLYDPEAFSAEQGERFDAVVERFGPTVPLSDFKLQRLNRRLLEAAFPEIIMEQPMGEGFLLADGDLSSPAVQQLQGGAEEHVSPGDIPWGTWWPTLQLWGGLALLIGLASLCIVVIVQPQWKHELIPFPIARFVKDISIPDPKGSGFPAITRSSLFWFGFFLVLAIHVLNAFHAWGLSFIHVPLKLELVGMSQVFPKAMQFGWGYFFLAQPRIYFAVIAFAFLLATEVSFSVGISAAAFLMLYVVLRNNGILLIPMSFIDPQNTGMLRFGSYLGVALIVFFVGRRYYLNVIGGAFGLRRYPETPENAVWAMRFLIVCVALSVIALAGVGLHWLPGLLLILLILLMFTVMARINVETGTFFIQPIWGVVGVLVVLFGMEAIGPTAYIIMAFTATLFAVDPRTCILPFLSNGMYMVTEKRLKPAPSRFALLGGAVIVVGFIAALCATLYIQYNHGLDTQDGWAITSIPAMPFNLLQSHISRLQAFGKLNSSLRISGLDMFAHMSPDWGMIGWSSLGLALVLACGMLRLRLSWWPLHPVLFLVWGTQPGFQFAFSFLVGWLIKFSVMRFSGIKGYGAVKPLMFGFVVGEILAALVVVVAGAIYFAITGLIPKSYTVFPM